MRKNKAIAMLLAGGQGTRLKTLTKDIAKPALPFGGKYRLIDFPLSNASNSGITDIGILTQYQPFLLNEHIGVGAYWAFNKPNRGLSLLPPYTDCDGNRWYKGTANAIYENMTFIEKSKPSYVLILSGDHIYKMDYKKMLAYHIQKEAQLTISVLEVPWEEASRFGIMTMDATGQITDFDEKPKQPKSNLASMGIYIFNWEVLKAYLIEDAKNKSSSHDFGKDIIPLMLKNQNKLFAYTFKGYWKDVGTVKSYWQANMDLLEESCDLDLQEDKWKITTKSMPLPPHYIKEGATMNRCLINDGCIIEGNIEHSVLFSGVRVAKDADVKNSVLFAGAMIEEGAKVYNAVVMEGVVIQKGQQVGSPNTEKVYLISQDEMIEE